MAAKRSDTERLAKLQKLLASKLATHTNPVEVGIADFEWLLALAVKALRIPYGGRK